MDEFSVIILAGGQSSRMGQDKALIPIQGLPLLHRTCKIALECSNRVLIVTSRPAAYQAIVPANCQIVEEKPLLGEPMPRGPLMGFAQGLAQVASTWVLLLACDLPYLQAEILQRWFKQRDDSGAAIALLPHTEKGWEPLCGFYHSRCRKSLTTFSQQGGRSFQNWLNQENVQAIEFSSDTAEFEQERRMLFNCNTPADFVTFKNENL